MEMESDVLCLPLLPIFCRARVKFGSIPCFWPYVSAVLGREAVGRRERLAACWSILCSGGSGYVQWIREQDETRPKRNGKSSRVERV